MTTVELDQLRSYLAVVDHGSFHAAARVLGLSQPAISQQIRKLELSVGGVLLIRSRAGCRPTPEASEFVRLARSVLVLAERTRQSLARGEVIVGASSNIGTFLLPALFQQVCERFAEEFQCRLRLENNLEVARLLEHREIDLGFMEWWDRRAGFQATRWRTEELQVLLPTGHPLATEKEIDPLALAACRLIGGEPATGTGTLLKKQLGKKAALLQVSMNLGSTQAVKEAVRNGMGVSLILKGAYHPEQDGRSLVLRPLKGKRLNKPLFIVRSEEFEKGEPVERVVRSFLESTRRAV